MRRFLEPGERVLVPAYMTVDANGDLAYERLADEGDLVLADTSETVEFDHDTGRYYIEN